MTLLATHRQRSRELLRTLYLAYVNSDRLGDEDEREIRAELALLDQEQSQTEQRHAGRGIEPYVPVQVEAGR